MPKQPWTDQEIEHAGRVKELGCYLCRYRGFGFVPAQYHHVEGRGFPNCHWLGVPLCESDHKGPHGWEGDRRTWRLAGVDIYDALADTIMRLFTGR